MPWWEQRQKEKATGALPALGPWNEWRAQAGGIGDFRGWKDHDAYQKALQQVLRDLQVDTASTKLA